MLFRNLFNTRLLTVAGLAMWLSFCGNKSREPEKPPPDVLTEEELAKVLADFALAESAFNLNVKGVPVNKFDSAYAFDPLKENGVSKAKYDSSLRYYARHPALYKKVYETVLIKLSLRESARDSLTAAAGPK